MKAIIGKHTVTFGDGIEPCYTCLHDKIFGSFIYCFHIAFVANMIRRRIIKVKP